jgi:hypothetical protein
VFSIVYERRKEKGGNEKRGTIKARKGNPNPDTIGASNIKEQARAASCSQASKASSFSLKGKLL